MFLLDMKTIIFSFVSISFIILIILTWGWIENRKKFRGIGFLVLDFLTKFVGFSLILSRGISPDFVSILIANIIMSIGSYSFLIGISRFTGIKINAALHLSISIVLLLMFSYFSIFNKNIVLRIIIISSLYFYLCGITARLLLLKTSKETKALYMPIGIICVMYMIISVLRIVSALIFLTPDDMFLENYYNADAFLILLNEILGLVLSFAIIMMVNNRLLGDIHKYSMVREKMMDKLYVLSITDALTNLYNRKKIEDILYEETLRSKRYQRSLSVMIIDIDHFKDINDRYGHPVGDKVLKIISKTLKDNIRDVDKIGRWGGEEFLVVAPETHLVPAKSLAHRLKNSIEELRINNVRNLTVSIGLSVLNCNEGIESFIKRVDNALYKAKKYGRNRIEILEANNYLKPLPN